jgi:AraC family transcriptional regulator of arabinose operon
MDGGVENLYDPAMPPKDTTTSPPDLLVTGHYDEREGYAVFRRHGSGNWLITYTLAGQGRYRQPGLALPANPGDLVLLGPDALHDYAVPPGGRWEFLWAHFHPRPAWFAWWVLPEVGRGLFLVRLRPAVHARVQQAFATLHTDAAVDHPLRRELALNGLEEVLLLAAQENAAARRALDPRVQEALDLIAGDLTARHSVASLARVVSLSHSRLAHLFQTEVNDSVGQTILSLRMRQAARLLAFTTRGVAEIAGDVGFHSAFYFSRQFHRRFGMSPRAYRAAMVESGPRTESYPFGTLTEHVPV